MAKKAALTKKEAPAKKKAASKKTTLVKKTTSAKKGALPKKSALAEKAERTKKVPQVKKTASNLAITRSLLNLPVLVIAGEHSGDRLGADLVHEMKQTGFRNFFGTGGELMQQQGVELVEHVDVMAVMGFAEVLGAYLRLKRLAKKIVALVQEKQTKIVVLIDYPGFNLRLAAMLKEADAEIKIIYLVSPQIWAWKYNRIHTIRKNVDLMLTLFEFEKDMYEKESVRSEWIGHPLIDRIDREWKGKKPVATKGRSLAVLPGSRRGEVAMLLPTFIEAVRILKHKYPHLTVKLPFVDERLHDFARPMIDDELQIDVSIGDALTVMQSSEVVLIASGTATLEAAYLKRPMVICYKSKWLNVVIASLVMRTKFIGLPNLLADEQVAIELLQTEVTAENIVNEIERLLSGKAERNRISTRLGSIRFAPKRGRPAKHAALALMRYLQQTQSSK